MVQNSVSVLLYMTGKIALVFEIANKIYDWIIKKIKNQIIRNRNCMHWGAMQFRLEKSEVPWSDRILGSHLLESFDLLVTQDFTGF